MKRAGTIPLRANVALELRDAADGTLVERIERCNLVVDAGLNAVRDFLLGSRSGGLTHIGVGTSATAASADQTALQAETLKLPISTRTSAEKVATFKTYFASSQANASLKETAIFFGSTMVARAVFSTISKTSTLTLTVTWELTIG